MKLKTIRNISIRSKLLSDRLIQKTQHLSIKLDIYTYLKGCPKRYSVKVWKCVWKKVDRQSKWNWKHQQRTLIWESSREGRHSKAKLWRCKHVFAGQILRKNRRTQFYPWPVFTTNGSSSVVKYILQQIRWIHTEENRQTWWRKYGRTKPSQWTAKGREHINSYDLVSLMMLEPDLIQKPINYVICFFLFQFLTFLITKWKKQPQQFKILKANKKVLKTH